MSNPACLESTKPSYNLAAILVFLTSLLIGGCAPTKQPVLNDRSDAGIPVVFTHVAWPAYSEMPDKAEARIHETALRDFQIRAVNTMRGQSMRAIATRVIIYEEVAWEPGSYRRAEAKVFKTPEADAKEHIGPPNGNLIEMTVAEFAQSDRDFIDFFWVDEMSTGDICIEIDAIKVVYEQANAVSISTPEEIEAAIVSRDFKNYCPRYKG